MGEVDRTYPIDFLLDGFSVLHNGNINLIILIRFCSRSRCDLVVPLLILIGQVLTGDKQREGGSDGAGADNGERDLIPWLVLRLPDERPSSVAHRVGNQDYGVDGDALCVTRC